MFFLKKILEKVTQRQTKVHFFGSFNQTVIGGESLRCRISMIRDNFNQTLIGGTSLRCRIRDNFNQTLIGGTSLRCRIRNNFNQTLIGGKSIKIGTFQIYNS